MEREGEGEGEGDQGVCGGGGDELRRIVILKKRSGQWREEKAGKKNGTEWEKKEREVEKKKGYIPSYSIPAQVGACHISSSCQYKEPSWRLGKPLPRR